MYDRQDTSSMQQMQQSAQESSPNSFSDAKRFMCLLKKKNKLLRELEEIKHDRALIDVNATDRTPEEIQTDISYYDATIGFIEEENEKITPEFEALQKKLSKVAIKK